MKVYNLRCVREHCFEGWFSSAEDFAAQSEKRLIQCPMCDSTEIQKMLSAPRLNLARETPAAGADSTDVQAQWLAVARHVLAHTEDVGARFAEEARRIHYNEVPLRGIRGVASSEECQALADEGIEVVQMPLPEALKQPLQ